MKKCYKCGIEQPKERFSKKRSSKDGLCAECKDCAAIYHAEYRRLNVEKLKRKRAHDVKITAVRDRSRHLKQKYGVTGAQFNGMFLRQLGMCGICSIGLSGETQNLTPAVDHCHNTGKIRGLLCGACNRGMGLLKDSHENCQKAAEWLKSELNFGTVDDNGNVDRTI